MGNKLKELLGSRKFYATLIGTVLVSVNSQLNLMSDVQMASLVAMISSFVIGQGMVDSATAKTNVEKK